MKGAESGGTLYIEAPSGKVRAVPLSAPLEAVRERYRAALLRGERLLLEPGGFFIIETHRDGSESRTRYWVG